MKHFYSKRNPLNVWYYYYYYYFIVYVSYEFQLEYVKKYVTIF